MFNWDRAMNLAQQYKQHVETVLWYRKRYLEASRSEEANPRFRELFEQVCVSGGGEERRREQVGAGGCILKFMQGC